jgi:hypothetical protein
VAEQRFGAALVEDGARIHLGRHLEGDARGMLALMRPVITSTDGRCVARIEMDAGGARLLRQPRDQLLDLLADDHHQVGELVDDDDDVRQRLQHGDQLLVDRGIVGCAASSPDP